MPQFNGQHPVVIVGGGIVGSSIALHLLDHGIRPILIDPDHPSDTASALSFASITALTSTGTPPPTTTSPAPAWPTGRGSRGGSATPARSATGAAGSSAGRRPRQRAGLDQPDRPRGGAAATRSVRSGRPSWAGCCPAELGRLLPAARPGPVSAARHAPDDACVEPAAVIGACRAILQEAGAPLLVGKARVGLAGSRVRVEAADEVLWPTVTVLAAGAATATIAADLGLGLDLAASPGMLVATAPVAPLTAAVVYPPGGGPGRPPVHLRQRPDGSVLVGERSQETAARDPSRRHARALVARAAHFFPPLAAARIERLMIGWRSIPADRLPVIGPAAGLPSVYLAVTPGAVTLAPALGRLVARELAGGDPEPSLEPFRPRPRRRGRPGLAGSYHRQDAVGP